MNLNLEFAEPVQWNQENEYSINDVVFNGTEAYTAIGYVPSGTALTDTAYWKRTGKYIRTSDLADGVVTTPKLADGAITVDVLPDLITSQGQGESVTAADASYLASLTVDGKAVQDGTPTPSAPVEVQVVAPAQMLNKPFAESLPYTHRGVTYSDNGDGGIKIVGTATNGDSFCSVMQYNSANNTLEVGSTYTISVSSSIVKVRVYSASDGTRTNQAVTQTIKSESWQMLVAVLSGTTIDEVVYPMICEGNEAKPYTPYGSIGLKVGSTITPIDLQGNVLASLPDGTKDMLTVDSVGHVVIDKRVGVLTFDGDENWLAENDGKRIGLYLGSNFIKPVTDAATIPPLVCDHFTPITGNQSWAGTPAGVAQATNGSSVFFATGETIVANTFKTWLSSNNVTVLYALGTPSTIDLGYIDMPAIPDGATISITAQVTPTITASWWIGMASGIAEAIRSMRDDLVGRFDAEITTLASSLATVENGTASTNYTIGSYLVVENVLYKVTSAIASGESIVPGTNVTATTVMAEILELTS